jgi:hypothetical protein
MKKKINTLVVTSFFYKNKNFLDSFVNSLNAQSDKNFDIIISHDKKNYTKFINKLNYVSNERNYMTLFIDNIRLYKRVVKYSACELTNDFSRQFKDRIVEESHQKNDLLELCGNFPNMNFIIFTAFDDSPIDEFIFDKIPENVISIYASNAITFGGKVKPIPYGIKRKFTAWDNNHDTLKNMIDVEIEPTNLLYVNHNIGTNPDRIKLNELLSNKEWSTVINGSTNYTDYLTNIKKHKFMVCPSGNAIGCECHRDWEVLYMRRVPIVEDSEYLREIFKDFPVLFVSKFTDITEDLLKSNDNLFQEVQNIDLNKLDISKLYEGYINDSIDLIK